MYLEEFSQLPPSTRYLIEIVVGILFVYIVSRLWTNLRTPGPWGLPFFGYYWFLTQKAHRQLTEFMKKYGSVYRINIAGQDYVHLGTIKAIREAHINQSDCFHDRPENHVIMSVAFYQGLVTTNGEIWRQQRKFFVQTMRDSGLAANREQLKGPVEESIQTTLQFLRKSRGKEFDMIPLFTKACTDAVVKLFLGNDVSTEMVNKLNHAYLTLIEPMTGTDANIFLAGSFAKTVIFPWIQGRDKLINGTKEMRGLLREVLEDHKSSMDPDQPPRDFIDCYIKEKWIREKKNDPDAKYFDDEYLIGTLLQAYGDGSSSVGLFVAYFIYYLTSFTEVQDDIHEEIVRVIGSERLPTLDDKAQLPLTVSTLKELLRKNEFFPISPGLVCSKDTKVCGVKVPKGCVTLMNFWSSHHDPEVYENPDEFDSTRFHTNRAKVEQPITFGMGKRSCVGENLVMAECFLFFAAILQNFLIVPANEDVDVKSKIMKFEKYEVIAVPRARGRFNSATGNA